MTGIQYESVQNNFNDKKITRPRVKQTKESAKIPKESALMSCSYLGYMTHSKFMGEE